VVCAMLCLLAAESASLHGLGPVGAVSIAAALLAQTTFLPALLLVAGRAAFWPRPPRAGQPAAEASRLWSGVGGRVARHPARVAVTAVVLLGAACAGLAAMHINNSPEAVLEGHPDSVVGQQLLAEHYPAGAFDPLVLLTPPREAAAAAAAARATPGVAAVAPATPLGGYADYSVTLSVPPYSGSGYAAVGDLRDRLDSRAPGSLVGGDPAVQSDITRAAQRDALVIIPLVLVVILIIVALLLRALVAPLVLVATTTLSFGASFGLATLAFRALGYPGIEAQIPLYIFIFLVALGVDYNIFLSARIREESRELGLRQGTLRGLAVTGGVITAAARPGGRGGDRGRRRRAARHAAGAHGAGPGRAAQHRRARLVARAIGQYSQRRVVYPAMWSQAGEAIWEIPIVGLWSASTTAERRTTPRCSTARTGSWWTGWSRRPAMYGKARKRRSRPWPCRSSRFSS
jgi:RND superfamily putative drug exporter